MKFIHLFAASCDGPFIPNPADIDRTEFLSLAQILLERRTGTRSFTETFLHLFDFYLSAKTTMKP